MESLKQGLPLCEHCNTHYGFLVTKTGFMCGECWKKNAIVEGIITG